MFRIALHEHKNSWEAQFLVDSDLFLEQFVSKMSALALFKMLLETPQHKNKSLKLFEQRSFSENCHNPSNNLKKR